MNMHPDILNDLAVLYQAGEASPATRELLEREALSNPELARQLMPAKDLAKIEIQTPDAQRRALKSIGHWNRLYTNFTGAAIAFTLLPFSIVVRHGEVTFFMLRDAPAIAIASLSIGIASAVAALRFRQLRKLH